VETLVGSVPELRERYCQPSKSAWDFEVRLPRILHGGLEGDHEHALRPEFLGELIRGEGLAEAHLGVPQEARDDFLLLGPDGAEVVAGLVHGLDLLTAHRERLGMRANEPLPGAQLGEDGLHILERAAHPFQFGLLKALLGEGCAHVVVGEDRAAVALGRLVEFDLVVLDRGGLHLLSDALFYVARGLSYLEESLVRLVVNRVGVDARPGFRLGHKDFLDGLIHRPHPSGESCG